MNTSDPYGDLVELGLVEPGVGAASAIETGDERGLRTVLEAVEAAAHAAPRR